MRDGSLNPNSDDGPVYPYEALNVIECAGYEGAGLDAEVNMESSQAGTTNLVEELPIFNGEDIPVFDPVELERFWRPMTMQAAGRR